MKKHTIIWGVGLLDIETMETPTHHVTSISIDNQSNMVTVAIEKGLVVTQIQITMEQAASIGFINVKALDRYL